MGFDPELFLTPVDDELKCPICYRVLEQPVQGYRCDHIYCSLCIRTWLFKSNTCPLDRLPLDREQLRPVSKMVINLLDRLEIKCLYEKYGCCLTLPLASLSLHSKNCRFKNEISDNLSSRNVNPLFMIRELSLSKDEMDEFNETIGRIEHQLNVNKLEEKEVAEKINEYCLKLDECQRQVREICDPLFSMILGVKYKDYGELNPEYTSNIDVDLQNLSEFTNEGVLFEYLRQNEIVAENIIRIKTYMSRSLNFVITVRNSERSKILDAKLWPEGVTAFIRGEKMSAINGSKSKEEPASVLIKAGIIGCSGYYFE